MCAMQSGLFIAGDNGRPPQAHKQKLVTLKTHIPVYSTSLDKGLGTRKPIEWQRLNSQLEVRIRNYLSTGKYYLLTIIKSQVYYP